jgi:RimJ/RimL family protein N-acetyltransferase
MANGCLPVGQISLYHIDWPTKKAEFGRLMIGEPSAAGKGLAIAATQLIIKFAFEDLQLEEVYLEVYADNKKAIHIYKDAGFSITDTVKDVVKMSLKKSNHLEQ